GHDHRPMTFNMDGTIAAGAAGLEVFWNVHSNHRAPALDIYSHDALTCLLAQNADGVWRGRWDRFEKMPIQAPPEHPVRKPTHAATGMNNLSPATAAFNTPAPTPSDQT